MSYCSYGTLDDDEDDDIRYGDTRVYFKDSLELHTRSFPVPSSFSFLSLPLSFPPLPLEIGPLKFS